MAALLATGALPAPVHDYRVQAEPNQEPVRRTESSSVSIPPYLRRQNYLPRLPEDFGDGGAFPEVHVVQYPLGMGRPGGNKSTAIVAVDVDEKGQVRYDAIVKQGLGVQGKQLIHTSLDDMRSKKGDADALQLPSEDEQQATAERTRLALEALVDAKIKSTKPSTVAGVAPAAEEPTYIRYTPNPTAPGYNPAAKQRVIRMVEAQVDPMEPPKHKHTKVPRGPTSPPAPVLHSPPRKLTVEDQQAWKIPSCVSNWKNARGYTIPLDKRLAADGRGLQEVTINNKFATLSESLYVAERKAAEGLKMRNQLRKKMAMQEKEDKERELRDMANRARQERSGALHPHGEEDVDGVRGRGEPNEAPYYSSDDQGAGSGDDEEAERGHAGETEEERVARFQREKLRIQRRKERERELRIENMKGNFRKNKLDRDSDRDVSEKVALGMHTGSGKLTGEAMYDSRLFNQSAGLDQGFGAEDEYNTYSKSLFEGRGETQSIYRPRQDDSDVYGSAEEQLAKLQDTSRFKADKGFKGAEASESGQKRSAPVQFERGGDRDPFGVKDVVGSSKKARHDDGYDS